MFAKYFLLVEIIENNIISGEDEQWKIKAWSPDYKTSFELSVPNGVRKSVLKEQLKMKMNELIAQERLARRQIITQPEPKLLLKELYEMGAGIWIGIDVPLEVKRRFFSRALPIASHLLNLVSLACASVMAYFGIIITTNGMAGSQILAVLTMVIGTSVALMVYSFSNVTRDMTLVGARLDEWLVVRLEKISGTIFPSRRVTLGEVSPIANDQSVQPTVFYAEERPKKGVEHNSDRCVKAVYGTTGVVMTGLIAANLTAAGITLYQTFQTMGAAAQQDEDAWLSDAVIDVIATTAVVAATASVIPFQGGFAARGTHAIGGWFLDKCGYRNKPRAQVIEQNAESAEWELQLPRPKRSLSGSTE